MSLIIFGSINMDLVAQVPHLPHKGETLQGTNFFTTPGGKGANQAVAAAKLGITTEFVGRVGGDKFGEELITSLQNYSVITNHLLIDKSTNSGIAIISVDNQGDNEIIVIPGANGIINETDVNRLTQILTDKTALLLQLEIPMSAVIAAAKAAKAAGVMVILDPAPVQANIPEELYPLIDIITPNEVETGELVGFVIDSQEAAFLAGKNLCYRGVKNAIVKLGEKGVICVTAKESFFVPAFAVNTVDTVAAGDAFNGALAAALCEGLTLHQAVVWGAAAGALAATKPGAQASLCDRDELEKFLKERGVE
ncbi:MAG: ribokinase [Nostocaceae cyanobacterium]|nr:ribokinase [Nostocaceae cyanobacterium]